MNNKEVDNKDTHSTIQTINWDKMHRPKSEAGLGIKRTDAAFLAKQG